jgi:hypothetical protein
MTGIRWSNDKTSFLMSISEPYHSGWHDVLVEVEGDVNVALDAAQGVLKDGGYYRPHNNWGDWERINTTYMKKMLTYHQTKVRQFKPHNKPEVEEE